MERLFLINFEKDPDEIYMGFEPQWFDDASYGRGLRIIAWRTDGYVDVYQQPGLTEEEKLDVAGKGLAETFIRPMPDARFNVTRSGIDAAFAFEDKTGRAVDVTVVERSRKPKKPFSLLAPVGSSSANPSALPVYLMFEFDFVRRSGTDVTIRIDGRSHKPDTFPFPLNGSRVYFMRYSADTFLVDWCPEAKSELAPLSGSGTTLRGPYGTVFELSDQHGHLAVARIRGDRAHHSFTAAFDPPVPDLCLIDDGTSLEGEFVLGAEASAGVVRGTYHMHRTGNEVAARLHPGGGWEPNPPTLFLKTLFRVAKIFRQWPKTYQWTAMITLRDRGPPSMQSRWERVTPAGRCTSAET